MGHSQSRRQRAQKRLLHLETLQRTLLRRAVDTLPGGGVAPFEHLLIELRQRRGLASPAEVAFDVVDAALLDLALVLRRPGAARADQEPVVFSALAVGLLGLRLIPARANNRGFQVVGHDPLRHATEERKRIPLQPQPGLDLLIEDELGILVPTPRERHHEHPRLARLARLRINHQPCVSEIHLRLLAGRRFHAHRCFRLARLQRPHKPVYGRVAAAVFTFQQPLVNCRDFHLSFSPFDHQLPIRLHRRRVLRRWRRVQRLIQQCLQVAQRRQLPFLEILLRGPTPILTNRFSIYLHRLGNGPVALAFLHPAHHLSNIHSLLPVTGHSFASSCRFLHRSMPEMKELRHWPTLAENAWPIMGESTWPTLGENTWPVLGENTWPSIARKMTKRAPVPDRRGVSASSCPIAVTVGARHPPPVPNRHGVSASPYPIGITGDCGGCLAPTTSRRTRHGARVDQRIYARRAHPPPVPD